MSKSEAQIPEHDFGDIYDLLYPALPNFRTKSGLLDVNAIAADMDMSSEGIYKILRSNKISPKRASAFIQISKGRLQKADFLEYVFE